MTKTNILSINFFNNNINDALKAEFMDAVNHESTSMYMQLVRDTISRLNKQADSLRKDLEDNGDDEEGTKQKKLDGIMASVHDNEHLIIKCEESQAATLPTFRDYL